MPVDEQIGVIGAGAWGTALAIHLARQHANITLYGRNPEHIKKLSAQRANERYLPGITLPANLKLTCAFEALVADATVLVIAIPSTQFRPMLQSIRPHISNQFRGVVSAVKGFELESGILLHEVFAQELPQDRLFTVLSGPSFASEVARGLPTAVTIAGVDRDFTKKVALLFHHHAFRAYTSQDVIGVELGGAFKNVLAIAAGIIDGLAFGANARAALITRGLAELMRFGEHFHADLKTLAGLAGVGDVVLSCTDNQSRNRRMGMLLAAGKSPAAIEAEIGQVVEGQYAAQAIHQWSTTQQIDTPICEQVYQVLNGKDPREAVNDLLARSLKDETD